jgi:Ca2+-binding EF-hand superfamily protein
LKLMSLYQSKQNQKVKTLREKEVETLIEEVFKQFDTDRSGFLEKNEIRRLVKDTCI